jgi:hypothetical protein
VFIPVTVVGLVFFFTGRFSLAELRRSGLEAAPRGKEKR